MCFSDECPREAEAADGGPHFENFCYGSQLTKSIFSALAKRPLHSHDNPIITQELHGDKCRGVSGRHRPQALPATRRLHAVRRPPSRNRPRPLAALRRLPPGPAPRRLAPTSLPTSANLRPAESWRRCISGASSPPDPGSPARSPPGAAPAGSQGEAARAEPW